jgi:ribose 5-phosphate isomerase A
VDGADEIKRDSLDLVKGLGGALLREKIVASAARRLVIIADAGKLVDWLGTHAPIPVEVTRFGWELSVSRLLELGGTAERRAGPDGAPFVTDGGNYIIDCSTGAIADPETLNRRMRDIVGVVETGLFIRMAELALVADAQGVTRYTPR